MNAMSRQHRFPHGAVVATPAALSLLARLSLAPQHYLDRHLRGDWGDLCTEDQQLNEHALSHGLRLLSSYNLPAVHTSHRADASHKLWIITEADRSVTTLLLPEDY